MSNGKVMIICLTVWLIKNISLHKISYFPESFSHTINKTKVELVLDNYAIKSNLKKKQVLIFQILLKRLI